MDTKQLNQASDEVTNDPMDRLLKEKKPPSSGKSVAILALLVALASVSATAWQWWQIPLVDPDDETQKAAVTTLQDSQQQLANKVSSIESQLAVVESPVGKEDISRLQRKLKTVENQIAGLQGQSGQDQASISAMQGSVRSLEQRLSATESSLVSLAASNQNSRAELNVAEIDFLLRTASERLSLFSDPSAADLALLAADIQLESLNDPMFLSVRQRIATSRQTLAAIPEVDRVQLTSQLADLQSRIPSLPFRGEVEPEPETVIAEETGWWESFKRTMSSLVTVRRRVPEDESLLSLEDKDYLRQGLWLQFESARLSLMRNDTSSWSVSLDRVGDTLGQYFENGSSGVQDVLRGVTELKQTEIAPEMPDISAAWTQLRQLRDSRRLLQSTIAPVKVTPAEPATVKDNQEESEDSGK